MIFRKKFEGLLCTGLFSRLNSAFREFQFRKPSRKSVDIRQPLSTRDVLQLESFPGQTEVFDAVLRDVPEVNRWPFGFAPAELTFKNETYQMFAHE